MTLNCAHKLPVLLLLFMFLPISVLCDEPQCASLQQATGSDAYELNQRIEDPLIPNTGDITNTIPTFAELSDMSLLTDDSDAMKQFENMLAPPSAAAPLIMLHPNTEGRMLKTIEIAAISTSDCVPGLIESQGHHVLCTETSVGDNPFKGDFIFRYYELQGETITQVNEANFSINSETFLPIHSKSLSLDGTLFEGKKLIARGLLVDVSPEGIIPPLDKPSYVSVQYIPTEHPSSSTSKADKFIYLPFSQAALSHSSANLNDSDYAQFTIQGRIARQKVYSAGSPIAHFAARYTLKDSTGIHFVSNCDELEAIHNSPHTHIQLTGNIDCSDREFTRPLYLSQTFTFDGRGHKIAGITLSRNNTNTGLFRKLTQATVIKKLVIENSVITGKIRAGILAGSTSNTVKLENITIRNSSVYGVSLIGGLAGYMKNTEASNINIEVNLRGQGFVSGIGGSIDGGNLQNITVTGSLTGYYNLEQVTNIASPYSEVNVNSAIQRIWINTPRPYPGDFDYNRRVNADDYYLYLEHVGKQIYPTRVPSGMGTDGNGDGIVNADDLAIWQDNFGNQY